MEMYRNVLLKEIISMSVILVLVVIVCIGCFIIVAKMKLEKFLSVIAGAILVGALLFGGIHLTKCFLDLHFDSFVTYTGVCEFPARDTVVLDSGEKLFAAISIPKSDNALTIIYAERSKIAVEYGTANNSPS